MIIGFMCSYFYPLRGGVEEITFNLAKELVRNSHTVHVFCSGDKSLKKEEVVEGIHIHRSRSLFRYKYYLDFNPGMVRNAMRYHLDVLHVQSLGFLMSDITVVLKKLLTKTKLFNTPHGPFMALPKYPFWQELLKNMYEAFEYSINRLYDAGIQVNPEQWRWMIKKGFKNNRLFFVPNALPISMFKEVDNFDFRRKYNLKNKLILSYVGRVQRYKGLDQVIRILPEVLKVKDAVFLIAGKDADDQKRLERLAEELGVKEHVSFLGVISDEDKLKLLDASDVFILPSEWEAFGIVILEAMARGNVIISTKTEGGKFLVNASSGFLYDFGDVKQLKEHVLTILKDKELTDGIKLHNINKALELRTDIIVDKLEALYREVK